MPNVAWVQGLAAAAGWARGAGRPARFRVGIVPAAGWSGLLPDEVAPFATAAAAYRGEIEIELWSHLTSPSLHALQRERFAHALAAFGEAGVRIASTDLASTLSSAPEGRSPDARVRIGIGLFGLRGEGGPPVRCAITIDAAVVAVHEASRIDAAGYVEPRPWPTPWLAVVRCGYSDGLPAKLSGTGEILSIGMQYAVLARRERLEIGDTIRLLGTSADLGSFLCGRVGAHEFVVGIKEES